MLQLSTRLRQQRLQLHDAGSAQQRGPGERSTKEELRTEPGGEFLVVVFFSFFLVIFWFFFCFVGFLGCFVFVLCVLLVFLFLFFFNVLFFEVFVGVFVGVFLFLFLGVWGLKGRIGKYWEAAVLFGGEFFGFLWFLGFSGFLGLLRFLGLRKG